MNSDESPPPEPPRWLKSSFLKSRWLKVSDAESPNQVLRLGRKLLVLVLGVSVVIVGIIMVVTPGPAIVVIPAGLAILATEFVWARRTLDALKARAWDAREYVRNRGSHSAPEEEHPSPRQSNASH